MQPFWSKPFRVMGVMRFYNNFGSSSGLESLKDRSPIDHTSEALESQVSMQPSQSKPATSSICSQFSPSLFESWVSRISQISHTIIITIIFDQDMWRHRLGVYSHKSEAILAQALLVWGMQ